jgi:hypothetical protein
MSQPATNTRPLSEFDTKASTVETDLSGDDFLALCGNTAWRVVWWQRVGVSGWRVKAVRVATADAIQPELRMPYRDD